jgi:hypothetical protein
VSDNKIQLKFRTNTSCQVPAQVVELGNDELGFLLLQPRGPSPAPKQSRKKSALTLAPRFGALIEKCALLLSFSILRRALISS